MRKGKAGQIVLLMTVWASVGAWAGETAVRLQNGVEIVERWEKDQHLYVKGELGVAPAQLAELEKWLDAKAPNWTVLLVQSASGESYRDVDGRSYQSLDAIEHAMGKGLAAKTGFGSLVHPETGQANGAFFILFLQERKFSYHGSAAYERRGLGANRWAGNLDAAAKRAMRNGGRVVEAARGTITDIDGRLAGSLRKEIRNKEEARLRAERRKMAVGQAITAGEKELVDLEKKLTAFRASEQLVQGDLAQTDTGRWQADFKSARQALQAGQVEMAETVTQVARDGITHVAAALRHYENDALRLQGIETAVAEARVHPLSRSGEAPLHYLRERVVTVRADFDAGNRAYRSGLEVVERGLVDLELENAAGEREARRLEQRAAYQRRLRSNTIMGVSGGAGALLLIGGVVGNRRRRKVKGRAEALLVERRNELKAVSDRLIALMDRAGVVVGPEADLPERGYEGETLAEAKRGIAAVDEAFVISSHVHDLIEQGAELIQPGNPFSSARNLVSGGRYQEAVDLLDAEVVCHPASPPPLPGSVEEKMPDRLGVADGEDFALELPVWTERLEETMKMGREALDIVDVAWSTIVERREGLQRAISEVQTLETRVETLAQDGWFGLTVLFGSWIPKMEEILAEAMVTSQADPVAALRGPIASGDRMVAEARALVDGVLSFREERWRDIKKHEEKLTRLKRATAWLDQRLDELTQQAEALAAAGEKASVAEEVHSYGQALHAMADRVEHASGQAERSEKKASADLAAATREVAQVRDELGRRLQVAAETVLAESPERDPSTLLREGRSQREAAQAALDVGEPATAEGFLDEVDRLVEEARALVQATQEAFKSYERERRGVITTRDAWERRVGKIKKLVATLRSDYSSQALLVEVEAGEGVSYADAPQRFDEGLQLVERLLVSAASGHATARLLEAREMLQEGSQCVMGGEALCDEVEARRAELAQLEPENGGLLKDRIRACEDLEEALSDRRVMRATLTLYSKALAQLGEARAAVEAEREANNPYRAASLLEELGERLAVLGVEAQNDLRIHQDAVATLEKVRVSEGEARGLTQRAQGDGIPDSSRTKEGLSAVQRGGQALAGVIEAMKEDHGDWRARVEELGAIQTQLSETSVLLRGELRLAQEAVATIKQAEAAVRRASRWSGRYGVRVSGTPGGNSIVEANRAIMAGEYHPCMRHAGFAIAQARQAIAQAEAQEAAIRRARAEAERRRRAAARRSRMRSSSSFGSSRSSSFGSSSSVGRSSFSSSSGVGRSGW